MYTIKYNNERISRQIFNTKEKAEEYIKLEKEDYVSNNGDINENNIFNPYMWEITKN